MGPLGLEMENQRLRTVVDSLHHDLMRHVQKHGRLESPCEHVTMRPPHLPCPHPECYTPSGGVLSVARLPKQAFEYSATPLPDEKMLTVEHWRVDRIVMDGKDVWAWRRA